MNFHEIKFINLGSKYPYDENSIITIKNKLLDKNHFIIKLIKDFFQNNYFNDNRHHYIIKCNYENKDYLEIMLNFSHAEKHINIYKRIIKFSVIRDLYKIEFNYEDIYKIIDNLNNSEIKKISIENDKSNELYIENNLVYKLYHNFDLKLIYHDDGFKRYKIILGNDNNKENKIIYTDSNSENIIIKIDSNKVNKNYFNHKKRNIKKFIEKFIISSLTNNKFSEDKYIKEYFEKEFDKIYLKLLSKIL